MRQDEAHTLPGCMYSGMQAVPHCDAGQGLFRTEGRAAAGCNPPDGAGFGHGYPDCGLSHYTGGGRTG